MNKDDILSALTPEVVNNFRTAIELGKWPDGRKLTAEQRQTCIQAVLVWEHEHLPATERTGYIHKPKKEEACASHDNPHDQSHDHADEEQPLKFKH